MVKNNEIKYPDFGKRLTGLMEKTRVNAVALSKVLKVSNQIVYRYMEGRAMPRHEKLTQLTNYFGVNPAWLLWGTGEQGGAEFVDTGKSHDTDKVTALTRIPVVGVAHVAPDGALEYDAEATEREKGFVRAYSYSKNAYAIRMKGDNLHPRIYDGEIIIVEPENEAKPGDQVLVKLKDDIKVFVKILARKEDDDVFFETVTNRAPLTRALTDVEYIHKISAFLSRGTLLYSKG